MMWRCTLRELYAQDMSAQEEAERKPVKKAALKKSGRVSKKPEALPSATVKGAFPRHIPATSRHIPDTSPTHPATSPTHPARHIPPHPRHIPNTSRHIPDTSRHIPATSPTHPATSPTHPGAFRHFSGNLIHQYLSAECSAHESNKFCIYKMSTHHVFFGKIVLPQVTVYCALKT